MIMNFNSEIRNMLIIDDVYLSHCMNNIFYVFLKKIKSDNQERKKASPPSHLKSSDDLSVDMTKIYMSKYSAVSALHLRGEYRRISI